MMKRSALLFFLLVGLIVSSCTSTTKDTIATQETYPNADLLINANELHSMLTNENLFLIDTRADSGRSFISGAVHFAAVPELGDPDSPIPNYLIGPEAFQEKMRALGLNQNQKVVIVDEGNNLAAARLFYAFEYYGFSNASLLNGGLAAWEDEGYPTSQELKQVSESGDFTVDVQPARFCDYETIVAASTDSNKIVFDVRSEGEYTGEVKRAERSGHIPNAINLEWSHVLESDGIPYFKPADEIQDLYTEAGLTPDKEIIPHCQTNVRGSHAYFTLRLMGYDSIRPYEASWAEYGNREGSLVEQ